MLMVILGSAVAFGKSFCAGVYKAFEDEPWKSKGLQVFPVDNYIVLYLPKEDLKTVNITRIIYGGRNVKKQLEETKDI